MTIWVVQVFKSIPSSCNAVRMLREELQLLQEQGSYVGEVVKPMDKKKVLVKVSIVLALFAVIRH